MIKIGSILKFKVALNSVLMPVQIMGISDFVEEVKNLNALAAFKYT